MSLINPDAKVKDNGQVSVWLNQIGAADINLLARMHKLGISNDPHKVEQIYRRLYRDRYLDAAPTKLDLRKEGTQSGIKAQFIQLFTNQRIADDEEINGKILIGDIPNGQKITCDLNVARVLNALQATSISPNKLVADACKTVMMDVLGVAAGAQQSRITAKMVVEGLPKYSTYYEKALCQGIGEVLKIQYVTEE